MTAAFSSFVIEELFRVLQPYTIQVEVELVGTPSNFATAFTKDAERIVLKVTDSRGEESVGVWRQACDLLRKLKVKKGTLLQMTGITRTKNNSLNTTNM
jgi:hypothetical protein